VAYLELVEALQMRLFPPPRPLLDRLGADFFKRIPRQPGVYLMSGEDERLLYVGKAKNLRQRLGSYKNAQPERSSRKVIRLVHEVRMITWELCSCGQTALLRENELLRLHKPKFNVQNTRPEHYLFIGLKLSETAISLRLTKTAIPESDEQLFGAFKGLGRVRFACAALFRFLWCIEHRPASLCDLPLGMFGEKLPPLFRTKFQRVEPTELFELVGRFLAGEDDSVLSVFATELIRSEALPGPVEAYRIPETRRDCSFRELHEQDLESLRVFFEFGPARNRKLRQNSVLDRDLIGQSELDDLLVLNREAG
jgi:excinuclease ABC subunit C